MYYKLKPQYCLRGWQFLPYAIVDSKRGENEFVDKGMFDTAEMCNGLVDFSLPLIPNDIRKHLQELIDAGIVEACQYGETIRDDQKYFCYDNRFMKRVHWSVTGRCNCKCRHCYLSCAENRYGELPHEDIMRIIDDMGRCGVLRCSITGGEPLVRSDFWEIIDAIRERGIVIDQIYSNGLAVNERFLDGLAARGISPEINMSFDGIGFHDWLRGIDGAEKKVRRAFELCREYGIPTGAEMCIWKDNRGVLRDSINYLASVGCRNVKVCPVGDTGAWKEGGYNEAHGITEDELYRVYLDYLNDFYRDLPNIAIQFGNLFAAHGKHPDRYDLPGVHMDADPEKACICLHARHNMYISAEGRALTCMAISNDEAFTKDYPLVHQTGLKECLADSKYMQLITTRADKVLAHNEKCTGCEYRRFCLGGCRAGGFMFHQGDILGADESSCKMFRDGWVHQVVKKVRQLRPTAVCPKAKYFEENGESAGIC